MNATLTPANTAELVDAVRATPRVIAVGAGTKPRLSAGNAVKISTAKLSGMVEYEPSEFTFTALAGTPSAQVTVDLATMRKDVRAMLDQGRLQGRDMPLTSEAMRQLDRASAQGLDARDCSQLPVWWLDAGSKPGA